jgi:hypothetical protein
VLHVSWCLFLQGRSLWLGAKGISNCQWHKLVKMTQLDYAAMERLEPYNRYMIDTRDQNASGLVRLYWTLTQISRRYAQKISVTSVTLSFSKRTRGLELGNVLALFGASPLAAFTFRTGMFLFLSLHIVPQSLPRQTHHLDLGHVDHVTADIGNPGFQETLVSSYTTPSQNKPRVSLSP